MSGRRSDRDMTGKRWGVGALSRVVGALVAVGLMCGSVAAGVAASAEEPAQQEASVSSDATAKSGEDAGSVAMESEGTAETAENDESVKTGKAEASDTSKADAKTMDDAAKSEDKTKASNKSAAKATPAFPDHLVEGLSPEGTTVDMFDYWITDRKAPDYVSINDATADTNKAGFGTSGINQGHEFMFGHGIGNDSDGLRASNNSPKGEWTIPSDFSDYYAANRSQSSVRSGLVQNQLGSDGYPVLSAGEANGLKKSESLAYLFNDSDNTNDATHGGKKAFTDVKGLLQVDKDGYYYYDSTKNFAHLDESSNTMELYDTWGVNADTDVSKNGQFFPFNDPSDILKRSNDGKLIANETIRPKCPVIKKNSQFTCASAADPTKTVNLNHYFGVHMNTQFVQPAGGRINANTDMTYEFTGDDDVWVFIDGVLVGDLGGIHNAADLNINFRTGMITVSGKDPETLKEKFSAVGKTSGFDGNRFADGSYHTLDFFYLERGNSDSNMNLKFNLVQPQTSEIIKVDQNGEKLAGASFELYSADSRYSEGSKKLLAQGTTDKDGKLELEYVEDDPLGSEVGAKGTPINFDKRWGSDTASKVNSTYYILRETAAPTGYSRMLGDMHLRYVRSDKDGAKSGSLESNPATDSKDSTVWRTGGVARSREHLTIDTTEFKTVQPDSPCYQKTCSLDNLNVTSDNKTPGMFAVVLKLQQPADGGVDGGYLQNQSNWKAVTGNMVEGWILAKETGIQGAIDVFKDDLSGQYTFEKNRATGKYEAMIDELPGYVEDYYFMASKPSDTKYTMAVYYTDNIENMTTDNVWRVDSDDFSRTFSSRFYVPNIKNELYVQKVDENGKSMAGAEFKLYAEGDVTVNADGSVTPHANVDPDTVTTGNQWCGTNWGTNGICSDNDPSTPGFAGAAAFGLKAKVNIKGSDGNVTQKEQEGFSGRALTNGTYYLVETSAPAGYAVNKKATKIIVNDSGIFADAGSEGDDVKVVRGVGQLVATMSTFGDPDSFDDTLRYLSVEPRSIDEKDINDADYNEGTKTALTPAKGDKGQVVFDKQSSDASLKLQFSENEDVALDYGPSQAGGWYMFATDSGWPVLYTTQDTAELEGTGLEHTKLDANQSLSSLITGSVMVQVTNRRQSVTLTAPFKVRKQIKGRDWQSDDSFQFKIERVDSTGKELFDPQSPLPNPSELEITDETGKDPSSNDEGIDTEGSTGVTWRWKKSGDLTLPGTDGAYYYRVSEVIPEDPKDRRPAMEYQTQPAYITICVQDGKAWLEGGAVSGPTSCPAQPPTASSAWPTADFTNVYHPVTSLPLTGGLTGREWLWAGLLLAGCAVLSAWGMSEWRRRHV